MKTHAPHQYPIWRNWLTVLPIALSCLTGCAYRPQLYSPALPGSAATGPAIGKVEASEMICGEMDPLDTDLFSPEAIRRVFGPEDTNGVKIAYFTDAGLVDRTMTLGAWLERFVDKNPIRPVENIRRGWEQDNADAAYMACVIRAFRAAAEQGYISAIVHGGDAVQLGVTPEFETYVKIVGKFLVSGTGEEWEKSWKGTWWETPLAGCRTNSVMFYQVLGNHEVLSLGTFSGNGMIRVPKEGVHDGASFASVVSELPVWRGRQPVDGTESALGTGTYRRGYYHAYRELPNGKRLLLVMLNTTQAGDKDVELCGEKEGSLHPRLGLDQLGWLRGTLASGDSDSSVAAVLVFGHHPLAELTISEPRRTNRSSAGEVAGILTDYSKVKAYICGHVHSGCTPVVHEGRYRLTEYVVPSLMEFPKSFAVVRVQAKEPGEEYTVSVNHHRLAELVDFGKVPNVGVAAGTGRGAQERFDALVSALDRETSNQKERLLAAAKCCYEDARMDLAKHHAKRFPECFAPEHAKQLRLRYSGAQEIWEMLKTLAKKETFGSEPSSWMVVAKALRTPLTLGAEGLPTIVAKHPVIDAPASDSKAGEMKLQLADKPE